MTDRLLVDELARRAIGRLDEQRKLVTAGDRRASPGESVLVELILGHKPLLAADAARGEPEALKILALLGARHRVVRCAPDEVEIKVEALGHDGVDLFPGSVFADEAVHKLMLVCIDVGPCRDLDLFEPAEPGTFLG